jgi:hypothetical protein
MAHQIDLFCIPQLADARRLEADQNGGSARFAPSQGRLRSVKQSTPFP